MDLGTLTNTTAELLLFGLVAGIVLTGLIWILIRRCKKVCVNGQITPGGDHEHETIGQEGSSNGRPGVQH